VHRQSPRCPSCNLWVDEAPTADALALDGNLEIAGPFLLTEGMHDSKLVRGSLTGVHGSLHETLKIGQMFASKQNPAVRSLKDRANGKPLSRTIERVRSTDPINLLPSLRLYSNCLELLLGFLFLDGHNREYVFPYPLLHFSFTGFRRKVICFVSDGIAAKNAGLPFLMVGAVETIIRHTGRENGKTKTFRRFPNPLIEEN
jgi:hypothetical protein